MKIATVVFLFFVAFLFNPVVSGCKAQKQSEKAYVAQESQGAVPRHAPNPYPRIAMENFTRKWKGSTKCGAANTDINLNITARDSFSVFISGFENRTDKVIGTVRGYTVSISSQDLPSAKPTASIEGKLVLNNERNTLTGNFIYYRQGSSDTCTSVLHF